jgi:hypothetical protein
MVETERDYVKALDYIIQVYCGLPI